MVARKQAQRSREIRLDDPAAAVPPIPPGNALRGYRQISRGLMATDAACLVIALLVGYYLRYDNRAMPIGESLTVLFAPLLWLAAFQAFGLYAPQHLSPPEEFRRIFGAVQRRHCAPGGGQLLVPFLVLAALDGRHLGARPGAGAGHPPGLAAPPAAPEAPGAAVVPDPDRRDQRRGRAPGPRPRQPRLRVRAPRVRARLRPGHLGQHPAPARRPRAAPEPDPQPRRRLPVRRLLGAHLRGHLLGRPGGPQGRRRGPRLGQPAADADLAAVLPDGGVDDRHLAAAGAPQRPPDPAQARLRPGGGLARPDPDRAPAGRHRPGRPPVLARPGVLPPAAGDQGRQGLPDAQVPDHAHRRRPGRRHQRPVLQDDLGPAPDPGGAVHPPDQPGRAAAAVGRAGRAHEHGRPPAPARRPGRGQPRAAGRAPRGAGRRHRLVADQRPQLAQPRGGASGWTASTSRTGRSASTSTSCSRPSGRSPAARAPSEHGRPPARARAAPVAPHPPDTGRRDQLPPRHRPGPGLGGRRRVALCLRGHGQQPDRGLRRPRLQRPDGGGRPGHPGRHAAGLGPAPARRARRLPRLRARPDPAGLRGGGPPGHPGRLLRRPGRRPRRPGRDPHRALPGAADRLPLEPAVPAPDRRGGGQGQRRPGPLRHPDPVRGAGDPQAGAVDGRPQGPADASCSGSARPSTSSPAASARPRRPSSGSAWSGSTAWSTSRAGSGGATCTATRGSWPCSRPNCYGNAQSRRSTR